MTPTKSLSALATALFLAGATPAAADVTLINTFEVPPGQLEQAIAAWEKARDFLSREPGYISTALHRSMHPNARFALINVARWDSVEAFHKARQRMREAGVFPRVEGLTYTPGLYRVIRTDVRPTKTKEAKR